MLTTPRKCKCSPKPTNSRTLNPDSPSLAPHFCLHAERAFASPDSIAPAALHVADLLLLRWRRRLLSLALFGRVAEAQRAGQRSRGPLLQVSRLRRVLLLLRRRRPRADGSHVAGRR